MTLIDRTAYPQISKYHSLRDSELQKFYTPNKEELNLINQYCQKETHKLNFALLYKVFQKIGRFIPFDEIPKKIVAHLREILGIHPTIMPGYNSARTKRDHCQFIRELLNVSPFNQEALALATEKALLASKTMNYPADIINAAIEALVKHRFELPSFETLDRLVKKCRELVNQEVFHSISSRLNLELKSTFDNLIKITYEQSKTGFNELKKIPGKNTITHFNEILAHHNWLCSFGELEQCFIGISKAKIKQFSNEARSLDASNLGF